jgi:uncharacterized protein YggE
MLVAAITLSFAALAPPALAQGARDGRIRILGHASVEAVPDYVTVQVGISNTAASPTAALDQNSAIARKIIDFAKRFGVGERDIRTDSINLTPAFKMVRDPNGTTRQEPDGYSASNMVRIKITDISRLGTFMRDVLDQGATNINGVQFGLLNPEKVVDEAGSKAVADATRQARLLAEAAKVKLGTIEEIAHPPRREAGPVRPPMAPAGPAPARAAVPVEVGTLTITSEVEITWRIE